MISAVLNVGTGDIKLLYVRLHMAGRVGNAVIDADGAHEIGLG